MQRGFLNWDILSWRHSRELSNQIVKTKVFKKFDELLTVDLASWVSVSGRLRKLQNSLKRVSRQR
jgi:hypothetical protein